MSGDQEELQQLSQQLEQIESQMEALQSELQRLRAQQAEIDDAIEALGTLDTGSTVQVPLGAGTYIRASVEAMDEVMVGIGGGYATERTAEAAVDVLDDRQGRIEDRIDEVVEAIAELESQGQELSQEAQQRLQRLQQQQDQGGTGGLGGLGGQLGPGSGGPGGPSG